MYHETFVKPSCSYILRQRQELSGEDAKNIYLKEVNENKPLVQSTHKTDVSETRKTTKQKSFKHNSISNKDLFLLVQNNDLDLLKAVLDDCPDKIHCLDEYGWSLLMIACQANAVEVVRELLKRGIDTSVRDKAGNSATSLIIKNKNFVVCDILLNYRTEAKNHKHRDKHKHVEKLREDFFCKRCDKTFTDKEEHLSSTIHNMSASKGIKPTSSYAIPPSNKGFQIMLKTGWDKNKGLGPEGAGKMYPIKTAQKLDRQGLGHKKVKLKEEVKQNNSKLVSRSKYNDRRFEINFRREFY